MIKMGWWMLGRVVIKVVWVGGLRGAGIKIIRTERSWWRFCSFVGDILKSRSGVKWKIHCIIEHE